MALEGKIINKKKKEDAKKFIMSIIVFFMKFFWSIALIHSNMDEKMDAHKRFLKLR